MKKKLNYAIPQKTRELIYDAQLVGANLERADLRGLDLRGVNLTNANLRAADLSRANLQHATLIKADLSRANCNMTDFRYANMSDCDMTSCYGRAANFQYAKLWTSHLRYAQFKNAIFCDADLTGVDFVCALLLGARFDNACLDGVKNLNRAIFTWWYDPSLGGPRKIVYDPIPGYRRLDESVTGDFTVRENTARERVEDDVVKGFLP